jgi:N-acetyl sugar amidotransferase
MICRRCVMDDTDPNISFDDHGVCNHCHTYDAQRRALEHRRARRPFDDVVAEIKRRGTRRPFDAVIGLSGGVDSSYLAYVAARHELRLLAVHLDNGWDSELAMHNIENLVTKLDIELHTHVVDWEEFRSLQVAYLRAGVIDTELLTDNAIVALMFTTALAEHTRTVLVGANLATEGVLPTAWHHRKDDVRNLRAIVRYGGGPRIRSLPLASSVRLTYWQYLRRVRIVDLLNDIDYQRRAAVEILQREFGWRDYGGKHYESFFTRFFQVHILPEKYGVEKRRAHLASLVLSGEISRAEARERLTEPLTDPATREDDIEYAVKKLGITRAEFEAILRTAPRSHHEFPSDAWYSIPLLKVAQRLARRGSARPFQRRTRVG